MLAAGLFKGLPTDLKVWSVDVRIHDLRHSFASFGVAARLPLPAIGVLLGHKDGSTTQRYAHLANDSARRAANDVAGMVASAMGMDGG